MLNEKSTKKLAAAHLQSNLQMLNYGMNFPKKLKQIMDIKHIRPKELADRVDVSPSVISQYRSGHRKPGREMLLKFSKALDVTVDELVSRTEFEGSVKEEVSIQEQKIMLVRKQFEKYGYDSVDAIIEIIPKLSAQIQSAKKSAGKQPARVPQQQYEETLEQLKIHRRQRKKRPA